MADTVIIKRRKRKKGRIAIPIAAVFLAAVIAAASLTKRLNGYLAITAAERVREITERELNLAASETLAGREEGFLTVTELGNEAFIINADTVSLGRFITEAVSLADAKIRESGSIGAGVEAGTLTGLVPLTGTGRTVTVRFMPVSSVHAETSAGLKSVGINQSLFTVSLVLTVRLRLILAGHDEVIEVKNTVPIAETVIAGRVPQVYTNVANEEDMLNLLPNEVP